MNNAHSACHYALVAEIIRVGQIEIIVWVDYGELFSIFIGAGDWLKDSGRRLNMQRHIYVKSSDINTNHPSIQQSVAYPCSWRYYYHNS
jgi:hypothetical protein